MNLRRTNRGSVSLSDGDLRIGPCRSQQLGQRQETETGQAGPGTREIIWGGARAQGLSSKYKGLQPFSLERQVRRYSEQPFPLHYAPPLPHPPLGSLGRNPLPPSTEPPLPQENCHLELTSVKTSFWPLNLGQKSWFGHKMTEWSISG